MTTTRRRAAHALVVLAALAWAFDASATESSAAGAGQPSRMAPDARVRGSTQRLVAAMSDAAAGSQTFRGLVEEIGRTDGIVYVMEGQCQHGVRACLVLSMTVMGANRVLWILIDPRKVDRDLMGSIGHELQHALEVLSHSSIRSGSAMTLLYKKEGSKEGDHFETDAAIKAGNAVRAELRKGAAAGTTSAAAHAAALTNASSHVRSSSSAIVSLIAQATERSATFRRLVEDIDASDSYVYLLEGDCGRGVRGGFSGVTVSGPHRIMQVIVALDHMADRDLMAMIGHELRHTIEAIEDPTVRSSDALFFLYQRIGYGGTSSTRETAAAVDAGNAVRSEVLKFDREAKLAEQRRTERTGTSATYAASNVARIRSRFRNSTIATRRGSTDSELKTGVLDQVPDPFALDCPLHLPTSADPSDGFIAHVKEAIR